MMTKTLYATALYLITCLASVHGLTIKSRFTLPGRLMQNSFFQDKCMSLDREGGIIQAGAIVTLAPCIRSQNWDISPSQTEFNRLQLTDTDLCLDAKINEDVARATKCTDNSPSQRFLFDDDGQLISFLDVERKTCLGAQTDGVNLAVGRCGVDQRSIWIPS